MKSKELHVRLSDETMELLKKLAQQETRTVSSFIEWLIKEYAKSKQHATPPAL